MRLLSLSLSATACSESAANTDVSTQDATDVTATDVTATDVTAADVTATDAALADATTEDALISADVAADAPSRDVSADAPITTDVSVTTDAGRTPDGPRVFYAGSARAERFNTVAALPDGTFVLGGGADDLDWIPASVPRTTLRIDGLNGSPGGARVAFLMHLSADLSTPLRVVQLPPGASSEVRHIKLTGGASNDLFISG